MCLEQAKGEGRCAETWEGLGVAEVLGYLAAFGARDEEEACTTVAADTSEDSLDHCSSNRQAIVAAAYPRVVPDAAAD